MKRISNYDWPRRALLAAAFWVACPSFAQTTAQSDSAGEISLQSSARSAQAWMARGKHAFRQKAFEAAAQAYAEAYRLDPSSLSALYNLAYAMRKAGQLERAEELYRQLLAQSPSDMDALFGWAETLRLLQSDAEAISAFESYAERERRTDRAKYVGYAREQAQSLRTPRSGTSADATRQAKEQLATAERSYRDKKFQVAAERYERAFKLDPSLLHALYRAALSWRKATAYERAKIRYSQYLVLQPENVDAIYGYAETLRLIDDKAGALEYFTRYISLEKRSSEKKFVNRAKKWVTHYQKEFGTSLAQVEKDLTQEVTRSTMSDSLSPDLPSDATTSSPTQNLSSLRADTITDVSSAVVASRNEAFPPLTDEPSADAVIVAAGEPLMMDAPQEGRALWAGKHLANADAHFDANEYAKSAAGYAAVAQQSSRGDAAWLAAMEGLLRSHYADRAWTEARRIERELEGNASFTAILLRWRPTVSEERDEAIHSLVQEGMQELRSAMMSEDYDSATEWAEHVLALDPMQLDALLLLGAAASARDATEDATHAFTRAAYLFPQACRPHWAMARLAEIHGQAGQARKHYQRYLETDCEDREAALADRAGQVLAQPTE